MKRFLIILLILCLPLTAFAEKDRAALTEGLDCAVYLDVNQIDTVIRPLDQPFFGTVDAEGEMIAFIDYVEMPDQNATFMRLTLSLVTDEPVNAEALTIAFGKESYTFDVFPLTSEYDTVYAAHAQGAGQEQGGDHLHPRRRSDPHGHAGYPCG